jgi:PAS domain S-box-containing protein
LLVRQCPGLGRRLEELAERSVERSRQERALLQAMDRIPGVAILVSDAAGTVELAGGDAAQVLGRAGRDLVGTSLRRVFAGAAWEVLAPALTASPGSQSVTVELARSREDAGERLQVLISARDKGNGHILVVLPEPAGGSRRRARGEEPEHRRLVDLLGEGMALVRDGQVEMANPALGEILGLHADELVGRPFKNHVAPEDVLHLVHFLRTLPEQGDGVDVRLRRADSLEPVEASIAAIPMEGDECLVVVSDRTASRRWERRLMEAHSRLDATLDATSDGILAVRTTGRQPGVIVANRSFGEMFGMEVSDLIDRPEEEVFRRLVETGRLPEGFGAWTRDLRRQPGTRRSGRFEVSAGGERKVLEVQATPLFLPEGDEPGRVIAFRDVTAQSQVERRLREDQEAAQARGRALEGVNRELEQLNVQLRQRASELDQANRSLKEIDDKRSRLLGEVTHELQTPLVSIRGFTEMILRKKVGPVTPDQERGLQISLKNIDRLIGLIDNLLDFIRAEGDLPELKLSNFRLDELVGDVFDTLRPAAQKRSINLKAAYNGGRPVVRADRGQIHQALTNLVNNAIKFSPEGREVVVEVAPSERGFAQLIVRDSGPGIPSDDLQRIFDRGYRAPGTKAEGSGLGLYITHQILSLHGCSIRASSPAGGGAVFRFTLPLAREGKPLDPPRNASRS